MGKYDTLKEYKDNGWEVSPRVKMSNPPVYTLTKGDETTTFSPKIKAGKLLGKRPERVKPKKDIDPKKLGKEAAKKIGEYFGKNKNAKGGIVKRYKGGLMVTPKRAKRGY